MTNIGNHNVYRFAMTFCCCMAAAISWTGNALAAEPRVTAEVTPERIYLGESARYRVALENCEPNVEPDLSHFLDFETRLFGKTAGSQSTVIINGRVRSSSHSGPSYEYVLTPKRSGNVIIPPARVEVDGKQYLGPALKLEVMEPGEQDFVLLQLLSDPAEVYPLQPFTLKLNVAVKALPEPLGDREPVTVQQNLPQLMVPWAEDDNLPPGVKPREPAAEWLRAMLDNTRRPSGFAINNFRTRGAPRLGTGFPDLNDLFGDNGFPESDSLFSMLREESRAAFHPTPQKSLRRDLKDRRVGYWEYSFDRTFTCERLGELTFGPASLKGMFATRVDSHGDLEGERIYAVSKAVSVEVKDAPLDGRPDDYVGAIGQFEAGAELNPTQVKVGDPMTLNVWFKGTGTLANIKAPNLAANPVLAANFRIYDATDQSNDNERRFVFSLRPKQADLLEFPAIPLSYFDVHQNKYVRLDTKPIPITIAPSVQVASTDIALPASTAGAQSPEARVEGVFANVTDLSQLRDETIRPRRYALFLSSLLGVFLATAVVARTVRKSKEDVRGQRRRNAARRARERLSDRDSQSVTAISAALRGMIADWCDESEQSLTTGDARRHLESRRISPQAVERLVQLLEKCDAARYGAQSEPLDQLVQQALALVDELSLELKNTIG